MMSNNRPSIEAYNSLTNWYWDVFVKEAEIDMDWDSGDYDTYDQFSTTERGLVIRIVADLHGFTIRVYEPIEACDPVTSYDEVCSCYRTTFGGAVKFLEEIEYGASARQLPRRVACGPGMVDSKIERYDADDH